MENICKDDYSDNEINSSKDEILEQVLSTPLEYFDLSVRTANCMRNNDIISIRDLTQWSEAQLLKLANFGHKSLREVRELLENLGLFLSMDLDHMNSDDIEINYELYKELLPPTNEEDNSVNEFAELDEEQLIEKYTNMGLFKKVELLGLSARAANCLENMNIRYVGDLVVKAQYELMHTENFGRKTLSELNESLADAGLRFGMDLRNWPPANIEEIASKNNENMAKNQTESLWDAFHRTISNIKDTRQLLIIEGRFGLKGDIRTLEDIAGDFGLTRERVRQIQKKVTNIILNNEFWDDVLRIKIRALLDGRMSPLYLDEITQEDQWFSGFESNILLLKNIITAFGEIDDLHFIKIDDRIILTKIDDDTWREAKYDILNMLEHSLENAYTMDDIELFVQDKLFRLGSAELSSLMFEKLYGDLNFSLIDNQMTLVSVGNSLPSHLRALLECSDRPLHYEDVAKLYEEEYGVPISIRYVHSCMVCSDFILFDRGTYGVAKHLNISRSDQDIVINKIEEVISSGPENRQWHSRNLPRYFEGESFYDRLNQYTISAILRNSRKLKYLGKFLWKLHSSQDEITERLQIKNVAYAALKKADAPLRSEDLAEEIAKVRGVGEHLQLHPNELYSRVDPSTWGLLERDFVLPLQEQKGIKDFMYELLLQNGKALHKSELVKAAASYNLPDEMLDGHILGILVTDDRFKSWHGGFIGLSDWKTPGRKTFDQVMKEVADSIVETSTTEDIVKNAREKLGYDFIKNRISIYLNKYGLFYDKDKGVWVKPSSI